MIDETITVGEMYELLKMGVLRFYLFTKTQIDVGEEDDELGQSNVIMDELNDVHERDEQLQTETDAFLDISEVVIGPNVGEPIASQLNDTLPYQPVLQIDDDLSITSVTLPITSLDLFTLDITSRIDSSSMLPPTNTTDITPELASTGDVASSTTTITVKLHRVNLLEEVIGQFKDEILLKHNLRYTYIDEKGADVDGISRDVYAAFWTELMDHTAEGEDLRVPSLCPVARRGVEIHRTNSTEGISRPQLFSLSPFPCFCSCTYFW